MSDHDAIDTAWRIHAAIVDWTGKVDNKASFTLAIESAVLAGVISMTGGKRRLANLDGWAATCFWIGVAFLVLSLLAVVYVVQPRLRSTRTRYEADHNFIYFGHTRHWNADDLVTALKAADVLPVLSRQIINMSQITWIKYRLTQLSLAGAVIAGAFLAVAAMLAH